MKKILILIGLFISANVYAQPKQIYVGGDVLTVSGDTLYKNGNFLAFIGKGFDSLRVEAGFVQGFKNGTWISQFAMLDTAGQFVTAVEALNDTVGRAKKGGTWTNFNMKGRNFHAGSGLTRVSQSFKLGGTLTENTSLFGNYPFSYTNTQGSSFSIGTTTIGGAFNLHTYGYYSQQYLTTDTLRGVRIYINKYSAGASSVPSMGFNIGMDTTKGIAVIGEDISLGVGEQALYYLPKYKPLAGQTSIAVDPTTRQSYWTTPSGGGGGGSDNFPTVDDTLTGNRFLFSDTYNLLFSHASGNAFTLSNTGLSYDIGGNNAILMNSSYNEIKTGNISTYGMLKTTNNTARLYTTDGTNTSTVVAHPKYVELDGKDSTVIKNIQEVAIDTATQHVAVLQGNQLKKVKYNVLKADSTLTITGDSIKVNLPAALGYREYVASLVQTGKNAPVATVLFNNLGDSVVWQYSRAGEYEARYYNGGAPIYILSDYASITNNFWHDGKPYHANVQTGASVVVYTHDSGTPTDELLGSYLGGDVKHIITIRVYD